MVIRYHDQSSWFQKNKNESATQTVPRSMKNHYTPQALVLTTANHVADEQVRAQETCCNTYLSICDKNFVSKMPRVLSRSDTLPLNSRPLSVKSSNTFRTTSPRYIPPIIFSYLQEKTQTSDFPNPWIIAGTRWLQQHAPLKSKQFSLF